ncbi:nitroreductase family protein [Dendrosporobacter sp. 1207_IL3150]|uniref:nitroreductase family protein n=1 Tax=Dendrosporobacter sp. 1207_IL3150 TaxID=3084054 RepID=UPI002FDAFEB5
MDFIKVDQGKCTKCGTCVAICPGVIGMRETGPQAIRNLCISCGQCVTVCPEGALDNKNSPLDRQVPIVEDSVLNSDIVAQFLRSRRSIRNYQLKGVSRDKIVQLLDIARMAPTACNSQGIAYYIVDNPDTLQQISATVIEWTASELKNSPVMAASKYAPHTAMMVEQYRQRSEDVVLRSAPCLIIAVTNKDSFATGRDNTYIAFSYLQLFATSLGLGTCWAGLFEYCAASGYEPLIKLLNIPINMQVTSGMMVGYPKHTYHRLVERNPLQVTWQYC